MKPYEDANVTPYDDDNVTLSQEEVQLEDRLFVDSDFVLRQLAVVNDNQLKRLLLGDVTLEEEARLEDRLFDDSDFVRQLAVVEEELIDDYLCGRLTDDERIRFQSHFMTPRIYPVYRVLEDIGDSKIEAQLFSSGSLEDIGDSTTEARLVWSGITYVRREQLLMIEALKRYAASSKRGSAVRMGENRIDFRHWVRAFFTRMPLVAWTLAAVVPSLNVLLLAFRTLRPEPPGYMGIAGPLHTDMHIREILLSIVSAAVLLGYSYYQVRWPAKAAESYNYHRKRPLSERHIRFMGWTMLAGGLVCLYAAVAWIIVALR